MPKIRRLLPIAALVVGLHAGQAAASTTQVALFQDDNQLKADPAGTLQTLRNLGVGMVRVNVTWNAIAPSATSRKPPNKFNATKPGAYPGVGWAPYDAIVRAAAAYHIALDFTLDGPAPLWATGTGAPRGTNGYFLADWEPSAKQFGSFVRAVGTRYSGRYKPRGSTTALPRVSFWSLWNEPNYGGSLGPQGVPGRLTIPNSPHMYRGLIAAGWGALIGTGHSTKSDRILIGELAPRGANSPNWGYFSGMKPLVFLRSLYCVDSRYRPLRGSSAAAQGCPTTAAGSRSFRKQNAALFSASGVSDHPYEQASVPNKPTYLCGSSLCIGRSDPDFADLPEVPRLERTLDRLNGVYGSHTRFPVWNTEYGFRTKPPDPHLGVSQSTAALYLNWAEYLSYRQSRLYSYSQYQLRDNPPPAYFDTALENPNGSHKPGFDAYRLPLFLPVTSTRHGRKIEVWGAVKPASYARLDTGKAQSATVQFQPGGRGAWQTLSTVTIRNSRGYFDAHLAFPSSGAVRLAWSYPSGDPLLGRGTIYSRTVNVTVR